MFWIGYRFFVLLLELAVRILSIWDRRCQLFIRGRKEQASRLSSWLRANDHSVVQIHAASLGEFELSLPLYHALKQRHPTYKFLFTFFSPSGYEHAKIPEGEEKAYLPIDKKKKVDAFLQLVHPSLSIFIKYEYWFEYLSQLKEKGIPYGYVNINHQSTPFNLRFAEAKKLLNHAAFIFTSSEKTSSDLLANKIKVDQRFLDLRYTKSQQLLKETYQPSAELQKFLNDQRVIICGSVWKEDIEVLAPVIKADQAFRWIIAPHKIERGMLNYLQNTFNTDRFFSNYQYQQGDRILLVDTIGDLKYLYRYGVLNYIGGAFNTGLHNVLEPIAVGAPIVFGPEINEYPEAKQLVEKGQGHSINGSKEFDDIIKKLRQGSLHLASAEWLKDTNGGLNEMSGKIGKHL